MDSLHPANPVAIDATSQPEPRVRKFLGTTLWGALIFAAMLLGQLAVVPYFMLRHGGPINLETVAAAARAAATSGLAIPLSIITGLLTTLAALWIAIRIKRTRFSDYLGLRAFSWTYLAIGVVALFALAKGWDVLSHATGHEVQPSVMVDVLKLSSKEGLLWLLVIAFCVAAPIGEELFARGFLYRGWSESFAGPWGAILLSSMAWTGLHVQYDWYFLSAVFSIGLLLGYLRYRSGSTWLTIALHGFNNLASVAQTILLMNA